MPEPRHHPELHPLADIDQVVHAPARLMMLTYLYVVENADYVHLARLTGLTWGNLSTLEKNGYAEIQKGFKGEKPHSTVHLTDQGRSAFRNYKQGMQRVLDDLPE